jgi:ABC-2 type transport system ATP-binding protein
MPALIQVEQLTFHYPGVCALDNVTFDIEAGTVTALVGPNGAGKTTLLSCLAALERPLAGRILLNGIPVLDEPRLSHTHIGYLPDFFGLYDELTVSQCLRYTAMAQGIKPERVGPAVEKAIARVQLTERGEAKAGTLSRGLRQRLAIAQAIIHEPRVLLLDEPASGLDPDARRHLSELLLALRSQGMTIIVSSHILTELDEYSTHMMVIRDGQVVEHRAIGEAAEGERRTLDIRLSRPVDRLAETLARLPGVAGVKADGTRAEFTFRGDLDAQHDLLRQLLAADLPVCALSARSHSLQQAYLDGRSPALET